MSSAIFVVWRESIEALLVIALLQRCLVNQFNTREVARLLVAGVGLGLLLAGLLAVAMQQISDDRSAQQMEWLQLGIVLTAAMLLTYTVLWLHRHSAGLKQQMQQQLLSSQQRAGQWGVVVVIALAVGREGAETVLFLYGIGMSQGSETLLSGALLGLVLALLSYVGLTRASRYLSWPVFFRISAIVLLLLAGSLLVDATDRLLNMGYLPAGIDPLFDLSAWLDDGDGIGQWLATLAGYRARPALTTVVVLATFWLSLVVVLRRQAKP